MMMTPLSLPTKFELNLNDMVQIMMMKIEGVSEGRKKDQDQSGKYDRNMNPGELQSGLLEQYEEILPQQTSQMHWVLPSHLDQEQVACHGNHDQQFSSLLHNPDAGGAGRQ